MNDATKVSEDAVKVSEVKERTWLDSIGSSFVGLGIALACGLCIYFAKFWVPENMLLFVKILAVMGMLGGLAIMGISLQRSMAVDKAPSIAVACPFCDAVNRFTAAPTTDFDCENCNRTVHFKDGVMIPVRLIICQACRTEHRVPVNIDRYLCDRCNRPLKLSTDVKQKVAAASNAELERMMKKYDVLLVGSERRWENELALKLQSVMTITLLEARQMMETASLDNPMPIAWAVELRKAESLRRQLEQIGATVSVQPNEGPDSSQR